MWKLFFKNKMIEIANWFYNHRFEFLFFGAFTSIMLFIVGACIFLSNTTPKTQLILLGSSLALLTGIPLVAWIKRNYEMAKKGIAVVPSWKSESRTHNMEYYPENDNQMYEANEETFEELWMGDNLSKCSPKSRCSVSDDLYIEYVKWELDNYERMNKKHRPNILGIRGTHPNLIFHGACIGCVTQLKQSVEVCKRCTYFRNNPMLPTQFTEE
jgi:hypothetical protein